MKADQGSAMVQGIRPARQFETGNVVMLAGMPFCITTKFKFPDLAPNGTVKLI